MELTAELFESIVREVMRRLRALDAGAPPLPGATDHRSPITDHLSELALSDRVVAACGLEGKLAGVSRVRVSSRAIVTPSAHDLLKDRGIELVRTN